MKALDMTMCRNKSLTMRVLLGLVAAGCFLPQQAGAQVKDIDQFVTCVNSMAAAGATVADAATSCVPSSGCYYTNTLSEESGQPACTLRDGTRLPRVIFSCTGTSSTLRFRPSFSLCTLGTDGVASIINHIELGEDVSPKIDHDYFMKMGDISLPTTKVPFPALVEIGTGGVLDTTVPKNGLGCNDCHDQHTAAVNLFRPIPPALADGTISTNDPAVKGPGTPVPLSVICADIFTSAQLARNPTKKTQAYNLCNALLAKEH